MRLTKKQLKEIIQQALKESYVPKEILEWTQETEKQVDKVRKLLEYTLDNVEDFPVMKREPEVRYAVSTVRKNIEAASDLSDALKVLYDAFVHEGRR